MDQKVDNVEKTVAAEVTADKEPQTANEGNDSKVPTPENHTTIIGYRTCQDDLVMRWSDRHPNTCFSLGGFLRYDEVSGIWNRLPKLQVEKELTNEVIRPAKKEGISPSSSLVHSVTELASRMLYKGDDIWDRNPNLLALRNGTYDLETWNLRPHSSADYATQALNVAFDPTAVAPTFERVISQLDEGARRVLLMFIGLALTPEMKYEKFLYLLGKPGCGKSTMIEAVVDLFGNKAMTIDLALMQKTQFAKSCVVGRTLLTSTEQAPEVLKNSADLSSIISGDRITIDEKYVQPFQYRPVAKLLMAGNNALDFGGFSNGMNRRSMVITVPDVPEEQRDHNVKVQVKQELPGIFNMAIWGLKHLQEVGKFEVYRSSYKTLDEVKGFGDPASEFLIDCYSNGFPARVSSSELYEKFTSWCAQKGRKLLSQAKLAARMKHLGFENYLSGGYVYWKGNSVRAG